ncbi:Uncharacterised protein [Mycobacteroides abscessus subsp. abscessus]|nr:Uncharacterised protein [Mycobacteroides abscessus subsp. abscessus]SKW06178.1 Uncharacterised protein [Mycobacteroides abscessus subsp. abscessus]
MEVEVQQGMYLRVHFEDHAAAASAVTPVGPAKGLELFAVHRSAAVTAGTCLGVDDNAINKTRHLEPPSTVQCSVKAGH